MILSVHWLLERSGALLFLIRNFKTIKSSPLGSAMRRVAVPVLYVLFGTTESVNGFQHVSVIFSPYSFLPSCAKYAHHEDDPGFLLLRSGKRWRWRKDQKARTNMEQFHSPAHHHATLNGFKHLQTPTVEGSSLVGQRRWLSHNQHLESDWILKTSLQK